FVTFCLTRSGPAVLSTLSLHDALPIYRNGFPSECFKSLFQSFPRFLPYHQLVSAFISFPVSRFEPESQQFKLNGFSNATFLTVYGEVQFRFQKLFNGS